MGLLSMLLGDQNPAAQFVADNRNTIRGIGAGLASGPTLASGLSNAVQYAAQGGPMDEAARLQRKQAEEQAKQKTATQQWLAQKFPDLAQMVDAGMPISEAWQTATQRMQPQAPVDPTSTATGRQTLAEQYGLTGQDATTYILTGKLPDGSAGIPDLGLVPVWGMKDGKPVLLQMSKAGGAVESAMPEGVTAVAPYDLSAQKAAGTAFGKETGAAQFDLPSAKLTMDQTLSALAEIRANTQGMGEQFGNVLGVPQQVTPAWPGSQKADFRNSVTRGTNLAFMQAREMLRGGGQITDFESKKAETAITDMQIAMESGSQPAFVKALADFEQAVKDGYAKLTTQAGALPGYGNSGGLSSGNAARPQTQAEFDALPSGTLYVDPEDGRTYRKD